MAAVLDPALIPRVHGTVGIVESCKCGGIGLDSRCRAHRGRGRRDGAWMGSLANTTPKKRRGSPPGAVSVIANALARFTQHLGAYADDPRESEPEKSMSRSSPPSTDSRAISIDERRRWRSDQPGMSTGRIIVNSGCISTPDRQLVVAPARVDHVGIPVRHPCRSLASVLACGGSATFTRAPHSQRIARTSIATSDSRIPDRAASTAAPTDGDGLADLVGAGAPHARILSRSAGRRSSGPRLRTAKSMSDVSTQRRRPRGWTTKAMSDGTTQHRSAVTAAVRRGRR